MTPYRTLITALIFMKFRASSIDLRFLRRQLESTTSTPVTAVTTTSKTNCTMGTWSEWQEVLSCNADCGSCGSRVYRRKCITNECPCSGDLRKEERCNIQVCEYPKPACCPPFRLMLIEGEFACGPQDENSLAAFTAHLKAKSPQMATVYTRQRSKPFGKESESDVRWQTTTIFTA